MDKKELLQRIIRRTEKKKKEEEERTEKTQKDIVSAPDYRQTWSDTTKFQLRQVKGSMDKSLRKTKKALAALKEMNSEAVFKKAETGALLKVASPDKTSFLFLVPAGSATGIEKVAGKEIVFLASNSPLAHKLFGKKEGQVFTWQEENFEILKIS